MPHTEPSTRLPRRTVFKWFAAAAAALQLGELGLPGLPAGEAPPALAPLPAGTKGYGVDPNLTRAYAPGDVWPLTLTAVERRTVTALADVIIPADDLGPAASEVRVPDFIDEWLSAPYPSQQKDRELIVPGLAWLESEAQKRFKAVFADLKGEQQRAICDDICSIRNASAEFAHPAVFFSRFRGLAGGAYFATPPGWKAIGYVGNLPQATFNGPPEEVLVKLGVKQTVM
jgi:hypothetical protein